MKKLLLLLSVICFIQVDAQVCFSSPAIYQTVMSTNLDALTSADFNGDGRLDLASANSNSSKIFILLNSGTGTFGTATSFTLDPNSWPNSITNADFNGDGFIDLATANTNTLTNCVSLVLGNGSGGFGSPTNFTISATPNLIVSEDFNGDGKADIAVSDQSSSNISILLGNGTGSFGTPTTFSVSSNPFALLSADFNRDGKKDLLVGNNMNLSVLLGTGTGSFSAPVNSSVLYSPNNPIAVADFNGDTILDIAAADYSNWNSSVYTILGTGTGSFSNQQGFNNSSGSPFSISCADFNGDGKNDVVAGYNASGGNLSVFLGNGAAGLSLATILSSGGPIPQSVVSVDFNGDMVPDISAGNSLPSTVAVFLNCISTIGVNNLNNNRDEINLYPNPASTIVNVELDMKNITPEIKITDLLGNEIKYEQLNSDSYREQNGSTQIDVSDFSNGIYFVSVKTTEGIATKKIVVSH